MGNYEETRQDIININQGHPEEYLYDDAFEEGERCGYQKAKRELGWHRYLMEKPTDRNGRIMKCVVKVLDKDGTFIDVTSWLPLNQKFARFDFGVVAWMPIPEEGGEK